MLQPPERPKGIMPEIEVIITAPYPGTKYHTELGIFPGHSYGVFSEPHSNEYQLEHGTHLGLEWRTKGGVTLSKSKEWASDAYILSSPIERKLTPAKLPELEKYHSFIKPTIIRVGDVLSTLSAEEGDPEEWVEYIASLQIYLNYLKYGVL